MFASAGGFDNHDRVAAAARLFLDQVRKFPEVGPRKVGDSERQGVCLTLAKALGSNVWPITQLTDCILNCLPRSRGDVREIIYYV